MEWWRDFVIIPIIVGIILLIIKIRNKNKNDEEKFNFDIKKVSDELDSPFQGSGDKFPLHTSCLKNILENQFFGKKYSKIFDQATQCLSIIEDEKEKTPFEKQQAMRKLKKSY